MICALIAGCGVATQPESAKTVAAFEVPLRSETDRAQFLSVLRAAAGAEGMHVDVESAQDLAQETQGVSPAFAKTMNASVWRGANDDEAVASAMDQSRPLGTGLDNVFKRQRPAADDEIQRECYESDHAPLAKHALSPNHANRSNSSSQGSCPDVYRLHSQSSRGPQI